ncbi:hypothetical protein PAXINDRAFT_88020, partial [Paxillus involutus ATCC 200175]
LKVLKRHTNGVFALEFFPDGRRLISGSADHSLIIWDVTSQEAEKKLTGHTDWVVSIAMAPNGSVFASGSKDQTLRIWDGTTGVQIGEPISVHALGYRGGVWGVSFSPEGQRVAATCEGGVMIWDVQTRALITGPLQTSGQVFRATTTFSPDGSRIAANGADGTVRVCDSVTGEVTFKLKGHTDHVRWTGFTPDGRQLVTASRDKTICRWDMQSGALIGTPLTGHLAAICGGVLSRDGKGLATASLAFESMVRFWDLKTGKQKSHFLQHQAAVWCVALSHDGSLLATGGWNSNIHLYDMKAIEAG